MWRSFRTVLSQPVPIPALFALLGALSVALCSVADPASAQQSLRPAPNSVAVVAHRGGAGLFPENTLAAVKYALFLGVDAIEIDVQLTADGQVVVYHDLELNPDITRHESGEWLVKPGPAVKSLTYEQLYAYDVGSARPGSDYAKKHPERRNIDGERIPLLQDVIDLMRSDGRGNERLWVEIKTDPTRPELSSDGVETAEAVLAILGANAFFSRSAVLSFDWSALKHVQKRKPRMRVVYVTMDPGWLRRDGGQDPAANKQTQLKWRAGVDLDAYKGSMPEAVAVNGGTGWSAFHGDLTPVTVTKAEELGLYTSAWTVNDERRYKELIAMGVNSITTDRPDILLKTLGRR